MEKTPKDGVLVSIQKVVDYLSWSSNLLTY